MKGSIYLAESFAGNRTACIVNRPQFAILRGTLSRHRTASQLYRPIERFSSDDSPPLNHPADGLDPSSHDSYERLLRQYQELAQLAGELAHEIKNPLSVIRMNMDLLAEDFSHAATHNERRALRTIATVRSQCTRLENLLRDFLKFSHMRRLQLRPGSLNEQVERILDFYGPQAREQSVEITKYLDPDLPSIRMDIESLEASLTNLVKNAIEAMPNGGQLTARTRVTRGGVALDLIDNGYGMEVSTAMHMFEPFYSTKEGGSGLGLPTAKKIIEAHGGRIDVQSEVSHGTQFTLEFPVPPRLGGEREAEPPAEEPN